MIPFTVAELEYLLEAVDESRMRIPERDVRAVREAKEVREKILAEILRRDALQQNIGAMRETEE